MKAERDLTQRQMEPLPGILPPSLKEILELETPVSPLVA